MEAWSRFLYCVRVGDQALCRAFVPSEVVSNYVDWFRVSSPHFFSPAKDQVLVLVQLIAELNTLVFIFICFLLYVSIT